MRTTDRNQHMMNFKGVPQLAPSSNGSKLVLGRRRQGAAVQSRPGYSQDAPSTRNPKELPYLASSDDAELRLARRIHGRLSGQTLNPINPNADKPQT